MESSAPHLTRYKTISMFLHQALIPLSAGGSLNRRQDVSLTQIVCFYVNHLNVSHDIPHRQDENSFMPTADMVTTIRVTNRTSTAKVLSTILAKYQIADSPQDFRLAVISDNKRMPPSRLIHYAQHSRHQVSNFSKKQTCPFKPASSLVCFHRLDLRVVMMINITGPDHVKHCIVIENKATDPSFMDLLRDIYNTSSPRTSSVYRAYAAGIVVIHAYTLLRWP